MERAQPDIRQSKELFGRAEQLMPGGVNSPARAFRAVGGTPRFIERARGSRIWDADGHELLDFVGSWGPMIFGHCHPTIVEAVREQARQGMSFGMPSRLETRLAELIVDAVPSVEMVRLVNSGTEATMSALRVARAVTRRELAIKFEGCYHGHGDAFLSKAGSGAATLGVPTSPGVTKATAAATLNARYNDLKSVEEHFDKYYGKIAAVIVEPIAGNMGCVPPEPGFLEGLRKICDSQGTLLIFDEVMTGFRVAHGGAQQLYGVMPDLTTLGKIVGGGMPVGAYGGKRDFMNYVSPAGDMYQAGTLSGNPLAMAAGIATLEMIINDEWVHDRLDRDGAEFVRPIIEHVRERGFPVCVQRVGSMGTLFFHKGPVRSFDEAAECDVRRFSRYFHFLLRTGIHMPPSQYECWFHSAVHTGQELEATARAICAGLDLVFDT